MAKTPRDSSHQEFKVPPQFKYQEGEKVLCFHGPLIYEAKCLQSRYSDKEKVNEYHIHYNGWNKSWDEWVPETRVLKYNEANLQKQKELHKAQSTEPKGKRAKKRSASGKDSDSKESTDSRSSTPSHHDKHGGKVSASVTSSSAESASDVPKRKRSKLDPSVESEEQFLSKVEIKIKIPDELKPVLFDDWENVICHKKLVKLPAKITADNIFDAYLKQKGQFKALAPNREKVRVCVVNGLKDYFNAMLGNQLLYNEERQQYNEMTKGKGEQSGIYGAAHLLRLFVRLGKALAYTRLDEKSVQQLMVIIQDFLKFLHKNSAQYFSIDDYYSPVTS